MKVCQKCGGSKESFKVPYCVRCFKVEQKIESKLGNKPEFNSKDSKRAKQLAGIPESDSNYKTAASLARYYRTRKFWTKKQRGLAMHILDKVEQKRNSMVLSEIKYYEQHFQSI